MPLYSKGTILEHEDGSIYIVNDGDQCVVIWESQEKHRGEMYYYVNPDSPVHPIGMIDDENGRGG